jgi:hypothetical protein
VEKRGEDNLKAEWDPREWKAAEPEMARIYGAFLDRSRR